MGFFAPWFLGGLLAVGLPVYVHLLRRQTTVPRPVSSLMFFEQGTQSSTRHRRLRYYVLFALRALLVVLLAVAFAQPFVRHRQALASDKLLIVAIDDSFSMRAGPAGATRLDDARRAALAVLAGRAGGQKAQVIALGGEMRILTQPIADAAALRAAVQGIAPADGHGTFGELGRGMRAMAETVHTPIELHLFSDMQRSNMPANFADMAMPGNVDLVLHAVGPGPVPNWTVETVDAPWRLVDTKKARVLAVIAGHGTAAATQSVSLVINGTTVATRQVTVPANGRGTVAFDGLAVPYGTSRCAVRLDLPDAFPEDNEALFAVRRGDPERVLFLHQASDTRSPLYFGTALASAAQASFILQPMTPDQTADIDPSKYAFVVLSDVAFVPSLLENALVHTVQAGGSVLIALGTNAAHREHIPVFGGSAQGANVYARDGGSSSLGQADASHAAMRDSNGWPGTRFFFAAKVDPGSARVVARLADGTPLLIDRQLGQGHAVVFASGFDNLTNDLPLSPAFVAFVDHTARLLSGEDSTHGGRVVDSFALLRNPSTEAAAAPEAAAVPRAAADAVAAVEIVGPGGTRPLTLKEAAAASSVQLRRAGFYQVRFANGRDELLAVNPDRRESDLEPVPADVLRLWSGAGTPSPGAAGEAPQKTANASPVWWWIMLLVAVTAVAESALASRYLGTPREQP
ncbi:MAG: BatA domain-containing protein [Acidobacteriota bacterium]|nr:BatA domain-containing protein [Acidobacteriota bacterium]